MTLYATEDAHTYSGSSGTNYGTIGTMNVSVVSGPQFYRSFLKFNLSSIPSNAVITSAILKLTPSGTENVATTNSTQLRLDICNSSWTETGINHTSNISGISFYPGVTVSNLVSSKREIQIKDFVQGIIEGRIPNNGFRLKKNDETTVLNTTYYTREDATLSNRPQLVIQYYLRPYVSAATIVHTSSLSSTDGSISPIVTNGSNTLMTYRWYNSSGIQIATTQNLIGVGKGWYGLKYYGGTVGDTSYQAFIVGTECEDISFTFDPGPNYIDDANTSDKILGSGPTAFNYQTANYGTTAGSITQRAPDGSVWYNQKSLFRFRLWIDPACQVNSANMTLTGLNHFMSAVTNASEFALNTNDWTELGVAYTNAPTFTTAGKINLAAIPSGNASQTTDIASFFNIWKNNNVNNFGFVLQLQSFASDVSRRMQFHSSDATTASNRPKVVFSIHVINNCDNTSFSQLTDKTDAGFATTFNNTLKFFFTEEYTIASGKKLPLKIFNEDNVAIAGIDFNGSAIPGISLTLPAINYVTDKNFVSLSLSGLSLTNGKFYTLEFTNTLGEKKYLKFKYTN